MNDGATETLSYNPYSWNQNANVVWIDQPAGVGYSVCDNDGCINGDTQTGKDNLQVLTKFMERFPELRANPLWLSGESYAGIYVPQMAINVHNHNQNATNETSFNLKGIMVGNGVTNWNYDTIPASLEIAYQRGLMDQATYDKIEEWGCNFTTVAPLGGDATPVECNSIIERWGMLTNKIDIYNIYGKCWEPKNTTTKP